MHDQSNSVAISVWSTGALDVDVRRALRRLSQADDVCRIAVMPDVHLAPGVCNGVVLATKDLIYPPSVGSDIGCGMLAAAFEGDFALTPDQTQRILNEFRERIPENRHSRATRPVGLPAELANRSLSDERLDRLKFRDGLVQLGTLGRGNHFVELQRDQNDRLWILIHSGSRGMGQAITSFHLQHAERRGPGGLVALDSRMDAGQAYLRDADWAVQYAELNRRQMLSAAAQILAERFGYELDEASMVHCRHNHVRQETHGEQRFWIHRKGAMPADEGLPGVIPGSMGTCSFHVTGRGCPQSLRSCAHGAGRSMTRVDARRRITPREFMRQMKEVVYHPEMIDHLIEESPGAYHDIRAVMRAQRALVRIVRELRPVLVHKGF